MSVYLSYWLLFVAALRALSVVIGYVKPSTFQQKLFSRSPASVTHLYGRTFAVWTSITCTLCVLLAYDINNRSLFIATWLSFVAALLHFVTEFLFYGTMTFKNLMSPGVVASVSIVWMGSMLADGQEL